MTPSRWFSAGLAMMSIFGAGHLLGFIQAARAARNDPGLASLTRAMQAHQVSLLGFHPSILDFREYFSLNFSILLWLAAALGYSALAASLDQLRMIRALSLWYVAAMAGLLATSVFFSVPQGIVSCAFIGLLFGLASGTSAENAPM